MAASYIFFFAFLHQSPLSLGELNVYGEEMSQCGDDHVAGCTYSAMDMGAHEVCVTQLPAGFSSETGQGPWSDQFTGQPWCICIWAYSNYILQNKDLPLKCNSIPAKVLEEQYSLDKFKQCGSMSSTDGCGAEDIRRSIQSLCQQCDVQADNQGQKDSLTAKCTAILAVAPTAPPSRLYETKDMPKMQNAAGLSPSLWGICGVAVAGLSLAMVVGTFRGQRSASHPQGNDDQQTNLGDIETRTSLLGENQL